MALRIAGEGFNVRTGAWYALEPQFQATSERLFGFTDVGSEREGDEEVALEDPTLAQALDVAQREVSQLSDAPTEDDAQAMCNALRLLRP